MGKKKRPPQRPTRPYPVARKRTRPTAGPADLDALLLRLAGGEVTGAELGIKTPFAWCLHCESVYPAAAWQAAGWSCPGPACDGGAGDAHAWETDDMPRNGHPEYPAVPVSGGYYPLYDPHPGHVVGEIDTWRKAGEV